MVTTSQSHWGAPTASVKLRSTRATGAAPQRPQSLLTSVQYALGGVNIACYWKPGLHCDEATGGGLFNRTQSCETPGCMDILKKQAWSLLTVWLPVSLPPPFPHVPCHDDIYLKSRTHGATWSWILFPKLRSFLPTLAASAILL